MRCASCCLAHNACLIVPPKNTVPIKHQRQRYLFSNLLCFPWYVRTCNDCRRELPSVRHNMTTIARALDNHRARKHEEPIENFSMLPWESRPRQTCLLIKFWVLWGSLIVARRLKNWMWNAFQGVLTRFESHSTPPIKSCAEIEFH